MRQHAAFFDFGTLAIIFEFYIPGAQEAFKHLPEARGFVLPKYEPVASHRDPKRCPNLWIFYVFGQPNFVAEPVFNMVGSPHLQSFEF